MTYDSIEKIFSIYQYQTGEVHSLYFNEHVTYCLTSKVGFEYIPHVHLALFY